MPIEDILLKEGLISEEQYNEALEVKKNSPEKTLCKILIELEYLDIGTYTAVMGRMLREEGFNISMEDILLKNGIITREQLDKAVEIQRTSPEKKIWRILIEEGFIDYKTFSEMISNGLKKDRSVE